MIYCEKCKQLKMTFDASYPPEEYIYGYADSPIWIIGLNPKARNGETKHNQTLDDLREEFQNKAPKDSYFLHFKRVSPIVFRLLGMPGGVAHTDVVKCLADNFPELEATENCSPFLMRQIVKHHPKLLICNGRASCEAVRRMLPPPSDFDDGMKTSYAASIDGHDIIIVLSGFLARIDNYAKRRLGLEIEEYLRVLGIGVHST